MYTLLIVEDEIIEHKAFHKFIKQHFPQIKILDGAFNGREGLEKALKNQPDFIILDVYMPEMDGLAMLKTLREKGYKGKVIIHSAFDYFHYVQQALHHGASGYILKPESIDTMKATLNQCLNELAQERSEQEARQDIRQRIEKMSAYLSENLITSLVQDEYQRTESLSAIYDMGITLSTGFFIFFQISPSGLFERNRSQVLQRLQGLIDEALTKLAGEHVFFARPVGYNRICIFIASKTEKTMLWYRHMATSVCESILAAALETMALRLCAGIGLPYHSADRYHFSYMESQEALSTMDEISFCSPQTSKDISDSIWTQLRLIQKDSDLASVRKKTTHIVESFVASISILPPEGQMQALTDFWLAFSFALNNAHGKTDDPSQFLSLLNPSEVTEKQLIHLLSDKMVSILFKAPENSQPTSNPLVQQALAFLNQSYGNNQISLAFVANHIGINSYYLSHMFKKEVGCSFSEYVTQLRMEALLELLTGKDRSVSDLGEILGYHDPSYFCKVVKRYFGKTLKQLKQSTP